MTWLMAGRTARSRLDGTAAQKGACSESDRTPRRRLPEARPVADKTPRWRAEGRRIFSKGRCATELPDASSRRAIPSLFCGGRLPRTPCSRDEMDDGVPGAAKNTGDFAWLFDI